MWLYRRRLHDEGGWDCIFPFELSYLVGMQSKVKAMVVRRVAAMRMLGTSSMVAPTMIEVCDPGSVEVGRRADEGADCSEEMLLHPQQKLDGAGEGAADGVEGGADLGGETGHGADSGEPNETGNERVLDEILTRFILQQIQEKHFGGVHVIGVL
jgi:hypothetical protein